MTYTLKIENGKLGWCWYIMANESNNTIGSCGKSAKKALEEGSKKLLELLPKEETFDFGQGPVAAHKHQNGGGWVADTAHVDETVFVGPNAYVYGETQVCGHARILDYARIFGHAYVYGYAEILGNSKIYHNARICGSSVVSSARVCGHVVLGGKTHVPINSFLWSIQ